MDRDGARHRELRELLGPYVLGALDPEEDRAVEQHLVGCDECRTEERGLRETHERLAGAVIAGASVPPHLKTRILASLPARDEDREGAGGSRRLPRVLAAAAALLVVALVAAAYSAGVFDPTQTAALEPSGLAPGAGGEVRMDNSGGAGTEAELEVWGLPRTGPNEYYELWFGREEGRVSAGTFTVDDEGRGRLSTICPKVAAGNYQRVGVTLEKFPEEPRRDSARVVLGGELQGS